MGSAFVSTVLVWGLVPELNFGTAQELILNPSSRGEGMQQLIFNTSNALIVKLE